MERVKANCNFSIDITMSINELKERIAENELQQVQIENLLQNREKTEHT